MRLNLVILKSKKNIDRQDEKLLRVVISKHARKAGRLLNIDLVNITVHFSKNVIKETGEDGFTIGKDWIRIAIDPTRGKAKLGRTITDFIPATVYHEMSHIARELYVVGSGTLLDAVIFEGLADTFAREQWPTFNAPWSRCGKRQFQRLLKFLKKEKNNKKFSHGDWFFGTGKQPRWLGYTLGGYIVQSAKEKNPGLTALKMMKMKTREIVKLGGIAI